MRQLGAGGAVEFRIAVTGRSTTHGISGRLGVDIDGTANGTAPFQMRIADADAPPPPNSLDALVVVDATALTTHLAAVKPGGVVILDRSLTQKRLDDGSIPAHALEGYACLALDLKALPTALTRESLNIYDTPIGFDPDLSTVWALGILLWLYGHATAGCETWVETRYGEIPEQATAMRAALLAGHRYASRLALPSNLEPATTFVPPQTPGTWRMISGSQAAACGLLAGVQDIGLDPVFCPAPSAGAARIQDHLRAMADRTGLHVIPSSDAVQAVQSAIAASFCGCLGVTATAGPALSQVLEGVSQAIISETPLVLIHVQHTGRDDTHPGEGAQGDLRAALHGHAGEATCPVLSPRSPAHAFAVAREAARIAVAHMTPVIILCELDVLHALEPFRIPGLPLASPPTPAQVGLDAPDRQTRDPRTLSRPWIVPGLSADQTPSQPDTPSMPLSHKDDQALRKRKIALIADRDPEIELASGNVGDPLVFVGWGGSYDVIAETARMLRDRGVAAAHLHLEMLHPLPRGLGAILRAAQTVLVPERNDGQLSALLRATYLVDARPLATRKGSRFRTVDLVEAAYHRLEGSYA